MTVKKLLSTLCLAAVAATMASAADITIVVNNNEPVQRQELVEINASDIYSRLGVQKGTSIIVKNALGQEVPYQITYDGKLLIDASVRP